MVVVEGNYTGQQAHLLAVETGRRRDYLINSYDGRLFTPGILRRFEEITREGGAANV